MNIDLFVNSLDEREKNALYKRLWFEYMKDDIVSRLDTYSIDIKKYCIDTDMLIDAIAHRCVYDGEYDCNLSYWANIDKLIKYYFNL